jgi:hypothetical protein
MFEISDETRAEAIAKIREVLGDDHSDEQLGEAFDAAVAIVNLTRRLEVNKWNELRDYINDTIKTLSQAPGGTNSITNLAKENQLTRVLQEMKRLDFEYDQDRKFEEQVKAENESLSEAADDGFYFTDVPDFDRKAWQKILAATESKVK